MGYKLKRGGLDNVQNGSGNLQKNLIVVVGFGEEARTFTLNILLVFSPSTCITVSFLKNKLLRNNNNKTTTAGCSAYGLEMLGRGDVLSQLGGRRKEEQ